MDDYDYAAGLVIAEAYGRSSDKTAPCQDGRLMKLAQKWSDEGQPLEPLLMRWLNGQQSR